MAIEVMILNGTNLLFINFLIILNTDQTFCIKCAILKWLKDYFLLKYDDSIKVNLQRRQNSDGCACEPSI